MAVQYDWSKFQGSAQALKYNRRDLPSLERTIARVPKRRVAVQAGGNLGIYPKRLAASFETVYTFEASAELFPLMMANAPESNIYRYQVALGYDRAMVGTSRVRRDGKLNAHEGITHIAGAGVVPTLRLDDFALPVCDLLCLDVEGFELFALRGAAETIFRCRPVLQVEINKNIGVMGLKEEDVRNFIESHRYVFVERLHADDVFVPLEWTAQ